MLLTLLIGVLSLSHFTNCETTNPGITFSSSIDGINQVNHLVTPFLFKHMKAISLPDVEFTGGTMKNMLLTLHEPEKLEDIDFSLNPKNNSIIFKVSELFAQMQGDFTYKVLFETFSGTAYVNVTDMDFLLELSLETQIDEKTGKTAPALFLKDIQILVDPEKIKIKIVGSIAEKIAEIIANLFKKEIVGKVIENTKNQAHKIVEVDINRDLEEYGTQTLIPDLGSLIFDYSLLTHPIVDTFIAFEVNGTFFDPTNPKSFPGGLPPQIPYRDFKGKAF